MGICLVTSMVGVVANFFRSRYCTQGTPLKDASIIWKHVFSNPGILFWKHRKKKTQATNKPYQVFLIKPPFVGLRRFCFFGFHSVRKERAVVHDIARKHGFGSSEAEGRLTAEFPRNGGGLLYI